MVYPVKFDLGFSAALDKFETAQGGSKKSAAVAAQKILFSYRDRILAAPDAPDIGKSNFVTVFIDLDKVIAPFATMG